MSGSGAIARSSRKDSLASIAQTSDSHSHELLGPSSRVSGSSRSRPSSPVNFAQPSNNKSHLDPTQIRPTPSSASSSHSSNSGFQVVSRPKLYSPPSPNLQPAALPTTNNPSPALGSVSRHPSLTKSAGSSNGNSTGPNRVPSGSSSHGRATRSNSPPDSTNEPKTTLTLSSSIDSQGRRMVNQYVRLKTIGQGSHGKVWLCAQPSIRRRERREGDEAEHSSPELGRKRSNGKQAAEGLNWDDDEFDESSFEYCAIKSVARDGPGRGKSLRMAKGRKQPGSQQGIGADDKVKREVAIMKRLDHQNVVRLKEVIDDVKSKKVFMVLEFMAGGQIVWQDSHKRPTMTVDEARRTFRDVVLGLEYLHYQGIIHRDIKPANLLWNEDRSIVKISDFGVSHVSDALLRATPGDDEECEDDKALRKTAGSPAFFAPELCHPAEYTPTPTHAPHGDGANYFSADDHPESSHKQTMSNGTPLSSTMISSPLPPPDPSKPRTRPPVGRGIDVWALGVTLYCLLFGDSPFMAATEYELYNVIVKEGVMVPTKMGREGAWTGLEPGWEGAGDGAEGREVVDLLRRLLEKDPAKRVTLPEVKHHPWVLRNLDASADAWLHSTDPSQGDVVKVTDADVQCATQERGAADELPQIRNRPGIRRALNAALVKFPAFRRKQPAVDGMGPRTRTASSTDDQPSWLSRAGSDRRQPASPDVGGAEFRRTVTAESANNGANANFTGANRGGWGNRSRQASDNPGSPLPPPFQDLARVSSTNSTVGGAISRLLPSRHPSSSAASRESRSTSASNSHSHTPQTVSSPKLGGPAQAAALAPATFEPEQRRGLGKMLSRFGGSGRRSRASSQQSPETDQEAEFEQPVEPIVMDDAHSLVPSVLDARFDSFGRVINSNTLTADSRSTEDDEVVDLTEFEYSSGDSDDEDEPYSEELLNGQPTGKLDSLSGWHNAFPHAHNNDLINADVLVSPATDLSEEDSAAASKLAQHAPPPTFTLHNSSPRPSQNEQLSSRALELDLGENESHALHNAFAYQEQPSQHPPPLVQHHSSKHTSPPNASPLPAWAYEATWGYPHAERDGYVAPGSPLARGNGGGSASKFDAFADAEESDEEEREVFIAPRRKRAATIERSNAHTPVTPNL